MNGTQQAEEKTAVNINRSYKFLKVDFQNAPDVKLQSYFENILTNQIVIMENQLILLNKPA